MRKDRLKGGFIVEQRDFSEMILELLEATDRSAFF